MSVTQLLKISTDNTKELLRQELLIKQAELLEKWHNASLEKIFIENRIYRDIEESESFDDALKVIRTGLSKYVVTPSENPARTDKRIQLKRDITEDDLIRLTEIKIKRISKYNKFTHEEKMLKIEEDLKQVQHDLDHLIDFAIAYFERLLEKYGKGKERRTEIAEFEQIKAVRVAAKNAKLYVNYKEGFIGTGLKKDDFICDCSDIDNIIAFTKEGKFKVVKIDDKVFIGKNILHVAVWKKGDERTTYNCIYLDAKSGRAMAKRFNVKSITRNKEYDLTKGNSGSKMLYFSANPNGEVETVHVQLSPGCKAKKKNFDFYFEEIAIKGRASQGNIVTKYPVRKVTLVEKGKSSLGAMKIWIDEVSGRLNKAERGQFLGAFDTGDMVLALYNDGSYALTDLDLNRKYEVDKIEQIGKFDPKMPINAVYFDGDKSWTMVKRFMIETTTLDQRFPFISEAKGSKLFFADHSDNTSIKYSFMKQKKKQEVELDLTDFMDVKGWKAAGNKLGEFKILKVTKLETKKKGSDDKLNPGETIELNF